MLQSRGGYGGLVWKLQTPRKTAGFGMLYIHDPYFTETL